MYYMCLTYIHSLPTRRSSDLCESLAVAHGQVIVGEPAPTPPRAAVGGHDDAVHRHRGRRPRRSEEHTSELLSQFQLVCRLLLAKKNAPNILSDLSAPNAPIND